MKTINIKKLARNSGPHPNVSWKVAKQIALDILWDVGVEHPAKSLWLDLANEIYSNN